MRSHFRAASIALAIATLAPATAYAQDAANQAAAQALFEQGRRLVLEGKYAEACPKLAESQRLDPGAGTLLNLGQCYEKSGRTASAWVTFKDAAAAADLKHRVDWSQRARERAQALEPTLSKLVIDVPHDARASGLQVWRDGVEVGSAEWGIPIPVDPGEHAVEAVAPGKQRWRTVVKVQPRGDVAHAEIAPLTDEPSSAAAPSPAIAPVSFANRQGSSPGAEVPLRESDGASQRAIGLVVGGVGVAGLITGSIFGGIALSRDSASRADCPSSPCPNTPQGMQGHDENDSAKTAASVSTIALIAGGAVLAAGAVIYFTAPRARSSAALYLAPTVNAGGAGLGIGGNL